MKLSLIAAMLAASIAASTLAQAQTLPAKLKMTWTHGGLDAEGKAIPVANLGFVILFDGVEVARTTGDARTTVYEVPAGKCVPMGTRVSMKAFRTSPEASRTEPAFSGESRVVTLQANHCTGQATVVLSAAPAVPGNFSVAKLQ